MKKVVDLTRSKRPFNEYDLDDVGKMQEAKISLEDEIYAIEKKIESRKDNLEWQTIMLESFKRMNSIALEAMTLDANDAVKISRAQGQFFERKALTEEMLSLHNKVEEKKSLVSKIEDVLKKISEKLKLAKNKE